MWSRLTTALAKACSPTKRLRQLGFSLLAALALATGAHAQVTCPTEPCAHGPLTQSGTNSRYWVRPDTGKPVVLVGSHTWNDFQDIGTGGTAPAFDFNAFVSFLQAHGHNATILWKKDMPTECNWQLGLNWVQTPWPWNRNGPGNASDGQLKFDLTSFNATFFNRLHARALQLYQANIYAFIEIFDGNNSGSTRCGTNTSPNGDGGPFTGVNNINGVNDNYTSGTAGVGAFTMTTTNGVTAAEDAFVQHLVSVMDDLPNVVYEIAEEQPGTSFSGTSGYGGASSLTFWAPHVFSVIRAAEASLPIQHPVGIGSMNSADFTGGDAALYASTADWIGPQINNNFANQFPANVAVNNQGKVVMNDSDHAQDPQTLLNANGTVNDAQDRKWLWENITQGAGSVTLMDPYDIDFHTTSPVRNTCPGSVANSICSPTSSVDAKWNPLRNAIGYVLKATNLLDLSSMTPQAALSSTGFALANTSAFNSGFLVYQPNSGAFTVNLTSQAGNVLTVQWLNPQTGVLTSAGTVNGGSAAQSFTAPSGTDAVLILIFQAPPVTPYHIPAGLGWQRLTGSAMQPNGEPGGAGDVCPPNNFVSGYAFDDRCYNVELAWSSGINDTKYNRMIILGGGHTDYSGNEIYAIDFSSGAWRMHRAVNPSLVGGGETTSDGRMQSSHTYEGLTYLKHLELLVKNGGCLAGSSCPISHAQWTIDLNSIPASCYATTQGGSACTPIENRIDGTQTGIAFTSVAGGHTDQPICDYWDKTLSAVADNKVYCWYPNGTVPNLLQIDYDNHINTMIGNGSSQSFSYDGAIEQRTGKYLVAGSGLIGYFDLTNSGAFTTLSSTGCSPITSVPYPGLAYDPVSQHIMGWPGTGLTVYEIIITGSSVTCTAMNLGAVTPPTSTVGTTGTGVMGRFAYMPSEDAFLMAASNTGAPANNYVYAWRRRIAPDANTYAFRCAQAGVIQCDPMDTTADTVPYFQDSNSNPADGVLDLTSAPPGSGSSGSAMLNIPANVNYADISHNWNKGWPQGFGQNSHFYVQYRYKMDTNFANFDWHANTGAGHKFSIFHYTGKTCGGVEITTQDQNQRGYPQMYSSCGSNNFNVDLGNNDFLYEQGNPVDGVTNTNTPYNCHRNFATIQECASVEDGNFAGWVAHPGEWLTFYYDIQIGTWQGNNSHVNGYFGYQGQPLIQFVNYNTAIDCNNSPPASNCLTDPAVFNHYDFLAYVTSWSGGVGNTPQMNVWYGGAIVSTQPIPDPAVPSGGGPTLPSPPINLTATPGS